MSTQKKRNTICLIGLSTLSTSSHKSSLVTKWLVAIFRLLQLNVQVLDEHPLFFLFGGCDIGLQQYNYRSLLSIVTCGVYCTVLIHNFILTQSTHQMYVFRPGMLQWIQFDFKSSVQPSNLSLQYVWNLTRFFYLLTLWWRTWRSVKEIIFITLKVT